VEVADVDAVDAELTRLGAAGLASTEERDSTCCYAKQTKFWVENTPGGERWEVYTVLADSPTFFGDAAPAAADPAETPEAADGGSSTTQPTASATACC
jgi:hypothetical protein